MAKRISLSERRERDVRGTDAFFEGTPSENAPQEIAESVAIEPLPSSQAAVTEGRKAPSAPTTTSKAPKTSVAVPPLPTAALAKGNLSKVTLYIRPDQVIAIETIQLSQRQKTGAKPDKSDLVQEAIDLLSQKYGLL